MGIKLDIEYCVNMYQN